MSLALAGVRRAALYSPNHIENDRRIIDLTAAYLQRLGSQIKMYEETDLTLDMIQHHAVFSMAQGPEATAVLTRVEQCGTLVINPTQGVRNCLRIRMVQLLTSYGIPFPRSVVVQTSATPACVGDGLNTDAVWIKRGDMHALCRNDVVVAHGEDERRAALRGFHSRGINEAVIQEHHKGSSVKFYLVRETEFFHWQYSARGRHIPFDQNRLHRLALLSAEALGLYVLGGDAIIAADGAIVIVDINDWPSFSSVRCEAGEQIAQLIFRKAQKYV